MLVVFELEEVSDEPEECDVNYEKVGCFKDKTDARALSVRIFSDRKNIDWEAGKWEKFLKRQVFQNGGKYNEGQVFISTLRARNSLVDL